MIKRWLKNKVKKFLLCKAKRTNAKIVVFESDDWGSERNRTADDIIAIQNKYGINLDNYQKYDCLESYEDIVALNDILKKHKTQNGSYPKFTLNYIMNNIDFSKKITTFEDVNMIDLMDTYKKHNCLDIFKLLNKVCLKTQLHGYEHFNYQKYLNVYPKKEIDFDSINHGCIGLNSERYSMLDACNDFENKSSIEEKLVLALHQFENTFGFKSQSIIFPCYVWGDNLEKILVDNDVKYLQGKIYQNVPHGFDNYKRKINKMGNKSKSGLVYLNRNVDFEQSKYYEKNKTIDECVDNTLNEIEFLLNKNIPAVICTHRVNYVSGIEKELRNYSLSCLDKLLDKLCEKYPDIIFMTSDELGKYYGD